ncbi:MAG TPA: septation regulator SpoVG [Firmicutes bacterium]|uniref:Putative septation protein SpoVG n=1 Tax=Candidatus Coatesbacteria bacterium 4484_99 TaxID=1970774 RepID=A0A1W9S0S7_9BACT|nr:MAG: septation protein SpoVG [Candidatus Coatesbacteria bacterium 4484_99]RLC41879.1 MAG: septation protein SpoVG [Candidatus Coatesbacteria bacterium]RLC43215.1 MAG: septation protein SpoVG [Candidatus Coatesbacteria bacterium]RLC44970.1 MAG: septation protein SpoVG [Candidatus Coatesbacteria bacterium]HDM43368.1 septation regulator SpoVG [Bacillota bacterium]
MEVTEVRLSLRNEDRLKAYATVTFDDCFVVRGLKVIRGDKGLFVAMPSRKMRDGSYRDVAHPINMDTRNYIQKIILDEYEKQLDKALELAKTTIVE